MASTSNCSNQKQKPTYSNRSQYLVLFLFNMWKIHFSNLCVLIIFLLSVFSGYGLVEVKVQLPSQSNNKVNFVLSAKIPGHGFARSYHNLTAWAEKEETFFIRCKTRLPKLRKEMKAIMAYIGDYEGSILSTVLQTRNLVKSSVKPENLVASSGMASYQMTYRYVHSLQEIKEIIASNYIENDLLDSMWNYKPPSNQDELRNNKRVAGRAATYWPNLFDISYAMQGLIHIQKVQNYDYSHLPNLLAPETTQPADLNAFHCAQLGLYALYKLYYSVAIEWIELAIQKVNSGVDDSIPLALLELYLEIASETHNDKLKMLKELSYLTIEDLFYQAVKPFDLPALSNRIRISEHKLKSHGGRKESYFSTTNFIGLCSGMNFQTPKEHATLFCWLDKSSSPARVVLPFKKELLAHDPKVVQVYDFIGNNMISKILETAKDCMAEANMKGESSYFELTRSRTATSCNLPNRHFPEFEKKVEMLTMTDNLVPEAYEDNQIIEYLTGGLFVPHMGAIFRSENITEPEREAIAGKGGDRFISLNVYLNDVPSGGFTPYCTAGTAAVPVKGSVIIWENVYRNRTWKPNTIHGACPVIYGRKQILSKFIRYNPQFRKYPCTLNKYE